MAGEPDPGPPRRSGADPVAADGPEVKICGLRRRVDAEAAAGAGAAFLGLVFAESPRRVASPSRAAELVEGLPPGAVGVFVDAPPVELLRTAEAVPLDVVQLHGSESPELCASLRSGGLRVWKALRPESEDELARAADRYRSSVDGLLIEGHSEEAAGGTGTSFPHGWWKGAGLDEVSRGDGPSLVLAGGLTAENVGDALARTSPQVVDVSSGVESEPGVKDPERIRSFVRAVRAARRRGRGPDRAAADGEREVGPGESVSGEAP